MKEWAKHHPWRLEIIPALSVVFALVVPLMYRHQAVMFTRPRHGFSQEWTWWGEYAFLVFGLAVSLIGHAFCNHLTLKHRLEHRSDWLLTVMIAIIGLTSNAFLLLKALPGWILPVWGILLLASFVVQQWLWKTIHLEPEQERLLPDLSALLSQQDKPQTEPVKPGETFCYRESGGIKLLRGTSLLMQISVWIFTAVLILIIFWWGSNNWLDAAWPFILFLVWQVWDSKRGVYFKVTRQQVTVRTEIGKKIRIRMSDIAGCCVVEAPPSMDEHLIMRMDLQQLHEDIQEKREEVLTKHLSNMVRRLEITTRQGKTHCFRLNDPDEACRLINVAISNHNA